MKTMKTLIIVLASLLYAHVSNSQELYGEQSWELTYDSNSNGWVDNGDIITNTIKITYNHLSPQTIDVQNTFSDPHFTLVEGSVETSAGIISSSVEKGLMLIQGLNLQASWDDAMITFDAIANFDARQVTHIYNKTQLISPIKTVETNEIGIPVKSNFIATGDKSSLLNSAILLLSILLSGMLFGLISNRLKVRRLSGQHSLD